MYLYILTIFINGGFNNLKDLVSKCPRVQAFCQEIIKRTSLVYLNFRTQNNDHNLVSEHHILLTDADTFTCVED